MKRGLKKMGKKGGGSSGPQEVVQTTSNLPEYARPYFEEMLGRSMYETTRPYEAYPGQRIADFSPYEQMGMRGMYDMASAGTPQQLNQASDIASQIGYQDSNMGMNIAGGFNPQQVTSDYQAGMFDPGYAAGRLGQGYEAGQRQAQYSPTSFDSGYNAGTATQGYVPGSIDSNLQDRRFYSGYRPRERRSQYEAGDLSSEYDSGSFDPGYNAAVRDGLQLSGPRGSEYQGTQFDPGYNPDDMAEILIPVIKQET